MAVEDGGLKQEVVLPRDRLNELFDELKGRGYDIIGPTVRNRAIVYDRIQSDDDLPVGKTEEQDGGHYRLRDRDDAKVFGFTVGPHSWRRFLDPPEQKVWEGSTGDDVDGFSIELTESDAPDFAFMGVRACDLNAIKIQDRIYMGDEYEDPSYKERREGAFIIALNCSEADDTCFCVSMDCGPEADEGYDLALTEIYEEQRHDFLVDIGSKRGAEVMEAVRHAGASDDDRDRARKIVESTAQQMGRELNTDGIKDLLYENLEHPQWDEVAERCLGCANCTLVCPTCFCSTVEDTSELDDDHTERWIRWDSCFNAGHSHLAGAGSVHDSIKARYRQWLTHKLGTWIDQFGSSGCTGCGRCITWCPVAIDLTEQVEKLRKEPSQGKEHESKTEEND